MQRQLGLAFFTSQTILASGLAFADDAESVRIQKLASQSLNTLSKAEKIEDVAKISSAVIAIAKQAPIVSQEQHVSVDKAVVQLALSKGTGWAAENLMTESGKEAIKVGIKQDKPALVGLGALTYELAPKAGEKAESLVEDSFRQANLEGWAQQQAQINAARQSLTFMPPASAIGSDPNQAASMSSRSYSRPSASLSTPPGTPCIDYNAIGPSVCKDGPNSPTGSSDGGDYGGRWALQGETCAAPTTITQTEIKGIRLTGMMGSGYGVTCTGSPITPIQYPNRWRYRVTCSGVAGAVQDMELRLSQRDADHLALNACAGGSCGDPMILTRCR